MPFALNPFDDADPFGPPSEGNAVATAGDDPGGEPPGSPAIGGGGGYFDLGDGVGAGQANAPQDVITVESILGNGGSFDLAKTGGPTGYWGQRLDQGIRGWQQDNGLEQDGTILPHGPTLGSMRQQLGGSLDGYTAPTPAEVEGHHQARARGEPDWLAVTPPAPTLHPIDGLPTVDADTQAANGRMAQALLKTSDFGTFAQIAAGSVPGGGLDGVAQMRDLFAQVAKANPTQAANLANAVLGRLAPQAQAALLGGPAVPPPPVGVPLSQTPGAGSPSGRNTMELRWDDPPVAGQRMPFDMRDSAPVRFAADAKDTAPGAAEGGASPDDGGAVRSMGGGEPAGGAAPVSVDRAGAVGPSDPGLQAYVDAVRQQSGSVIDAINAPVAPAAAGQHGDAAAGQTTESSPPSGLPGGGAADGDAGTSAGAPNVTPNTTMTGDNGKVWQVGGGWTDSAAASPPKIGGLKGSWEIGRGADLNPDLAPNRFDAFTKGVFRREGGYSNDPSDHGGETNHGITTKILDGYQRQHGGLGEGGTAVAPKDLTQEQAKNVYKAVFYDGHRIGEINDDKTAEHIFDLGVLHQPKPAGIMIQEAINDTIPGANLPIDGNVGSKTIAALNNASVDQLTAMNNALVDKRIAFFNAIAKSDPSQARFVNGWVRRANKFRP